MTAPAFFTPAVLDALDQLGHQLKFSLHLFDFTTKLPFGGTATWPLGPRNGAVCHRLRRVAFPRVARHRQCQGMVLHEIAHVVAAKEPPNEVDEVTSAMLAVEQAMARQLGWLAGWRRWMNDGFSLGSSPGNPEMEWSEVHWRRQQEVLRASGEVGQQLGLLDDKGELREGVIFPGQVERAGAPWGVQVHKAPPSASWLRGG